MVLVDIGYENVYSIWRVQDRIQRLEFMIMVS